MRIAFVCSGNICRSPLAEGLARLIDQGGNEFVSAGTHPDIGWGATAAAQRVAAEVGGDLSGHRARGLEVLHEPEPSWVYVMEPHHLQTVRTLLPGGTHRVHLLDPDGVPVPDPYQRSDAFYRRVRDQIVAALHVRAADWREVG